VFWDVWLLRTALGWPGVAGRPWLAAAVFALWAAGFAALTLRLRAALREADSPGSAQTGSARGGH
jgi:hypothetical protein